jgi:chromosome partitioning protein
MKVLALVSQKGGSGRSLLAVHLAVAMEDAGFYTVLIDLDAQGSAVTWGKLRGKDAPLVVAGVASHLPDMLTASRKAGVDLIIIDTPPYNSAIGSMAASAADLVLIPMRPAMFDADSIRGTANILKLARKTKRAIALLNAVKSEGPRSDEARKHMEALGIELAPGVILDRYAYIDALAAGKGVTEFEPNGRAADELRGLRKFLADRMKLKKGADQHEQA